MSSTQTFFFAAVGDVHGHMQRMVSHLSAWEERTRSPLDFVLQVGDFEPHRDDADLATMAAPMKYRHLGDFAAYHQRRRRFPWPLYFIGGNHEPYGHLDQHPEGATLAPHCHYLGRTGMVELNGLRVAGLSGIHREATFTKPRPPLASMRDVSNKDFTFFNEQDVDRVLALGHVDVLLLHDWPAGIIPPEEAVHFEGLRRSANPELVGNEYARLLVDALQPQLVLCGHLHRRYATTLQHPNGQQSRVRCLASVDQGTDAFAVFRVQGTTLQEVTDPK